jgi:hypothetical protein
VLRAAASAHFSSLIPTKSLPPSCRSRFSLAPSACQVRASRTSATLRGSVQHKCSEPAEQRAALLADSVVIGSTTATKS